MNLWQSSVANRIVITVFAFTLVWLWVFSDTVSDVIRVWLGSHTFNHCFFVLPIAIYLAFERKAEVLNTPTKVAWLGLVLLWLFQVLWLFGLAAHISLFQHAAIFAMLSSFILFAFGWSVAKVVWFPLAFLVFAIPFGEELVPYFQNITADLSIFFVKLLDIPVYRDGLFITIPAGHFEVAEACSGIRFFIACIVLGSVYAYLNLFSMPGRIGFLAISVILPIIANGLRAFGTIAIGHYSGMKYAVGADHLVYGWGFFAFVIVLLFIIGYFWQKVDAYFLRSIPESRKGKKPVSDVVHPSWAQRRWHLVILLGLLPLVLSYFLGLSIQNQTQSGVSVSADQLPKERLSISEQQAWLPNFPKAQTQYYGETPDGVSYFVALYPKNSKESELVSWQNRPFRIEHWRHDQAHSMQIDDKTVFFNEVLSAIGERRLILSWYHLPNLTTANQLMVKSMQAMSAILGQNTSGAFVAISISYNRDKGSASRDSAMSKLEAAFKENYGVLNGAIQFEKPE